MRKVLILIVLVIPTLLFSQRRNRYKWEFVGGVGIDNLFSSLGGSPDIGSHGIVGIKDWNIPATRPGINFGVRYKNSKHFAFKSTATFAWLYANDNLSTNFVRNNRNLNVRTPIFELSAQIEYYPFKEKQTRLLYRVKKAMGKHRLHLAQFQPYLFVGIGGFYFNPQGYNANYGGWVNLAPLHTEGQGLPGGPAPYSQVAVSFPVGFGLKYPVNRRLSIGLEVAVHFTTSSYIDDAGGNYYNPADFIKYEGPKLGAESAAFADPSLDGGKSGNSAPGQERASSHKDAFMTAMITVNYKIHTRRRVRTKF